MQKRRSFIITFMLVAALTLGIGYAALSDDLFIDTTVNFNPETAEEELDVDVKFISATSNDYCTAGVSGTDPSGDTAYLHVGGEDVPLELTTPGQSAVATFTVENNYEAAVNVSVVTDLANLYEYYDIEVDCTGAQNIAGVGSGAAGTGTITVTVTPKAVLTEIIEADTFQIKLLAEVIG